MERKSPEELRSHRWFGESDMRGFGHHSRTAQMGYSRADYLGKPIIAVINTWSDINACHAHFRQRADEVKRGVLQAGGFPLEMPAMALAEVFQKPTTMLYRNLLGMETEELLRSYPVDGCVLMGGCDKTTPALLMRAARIDDPALPVTKDSVIVLQNAGPLGAPGMPERGQLPIPKKLLAQGVRDMVRISDARMSGTSYGACVLHVAPESYIGGPLALVRDGDLIELDVGARKLELSDTELSRRRDAWKKPPQRYERGFSALYQQHVTQADQGCDFDFLEGTVPTPEPEIH